MDLVLELKNNASKLLLAVMENRDDSENAEKDFVQHESSPASGCCLQSLSSKVGWQ